MAAIYRTPRDWLDDCKRLPSHDMDNVVLYTGPERMGKSTLALQHMQYLDPSFSMEDVCGGIPDFIRRLKAKPGKGGAILADEIRAHRRAAMRTDTVQLIETLTACGGLNRHLGLSYPHESLFEGFILDHRIRWKCHVPGPEELGLAPTIRPGVFLLYQRTVRRWRDPRSGQETTYVQWVQRGAWKFYPARGPLWDVYLAKKNERMRSTDASLITPPATDAAFSRFDWYPRVVQLGRDIWRERQDADKGSSSADIRASP
ncbi:MAG: hypothetical protein ACYDDF_05345 [Thermoplasmatota archaeon]